MKKTLLSAAIALTAACSTVRSSGIRAGTEQSGPVSDASLVRLTTMREPCQGHQVGIVEAHGSPNEFEGIFERFKREVANLGGDLGKIDEIKTKFEMVTETYTYSYSCGKSTCTGTSTRTVEKPTTGVVGRAYRTQG